MTGPWSPYEVRVLRFLTRDLRWSAARVAPHLNRSIHAIRHARRRYLKEN